MAWGIAPEPAPTLAVSEEGGGVLGLYLSGVSTAQLADWLAPLGEDTSLLCLSGADAPPDAAQLPGGCWVTAARHLADLEGPAEFAAAAAAVDPAELLERLPTSVLAWPDRALPDGVQFALAIQDAEHAVLYARESAPLRAVLRGLITDVVVDAFGESPPVGDDALDELLEPSPLGAWRRVQITQRRRYLQLDFHAFTEEGPDPAMDRSWVARAGGEWRHGWSW